MADVLEELYEVARGRLGAYGYVLTGSQHAGEELVQEAVVKVFVRKRRLDNVRMAEAYVRTTMRRLHIDRIRRDVAWRKVAPAQAQPEHRPDASEHVVSQDAATRALAELPARVRTAIALRYLDDMTVAQVADAMALSEGTVKRYLSDGRALLGPALGIADPHDDDSDSDEHISVRVVEGRTL